MFVHVQPVSPLGENVVLTNTRVFSPDSRWLVYDTRTQDSQFDAERISKVDVYNGKVRELIRAENQSKIGAATYSPRDPRIVFIQGPENPSPDWQYAPYRRRGVIFDEEMRRRTNLDAVDYHPPYTVGALRGGTHLHQYDGSGEWVSFTYEDHVLAKVENPALDQDKNQRNVGISIPLKSVLVPKQKYNHDGTMFSFLITKTTSHPRPGSDDITRAFEDSWIGRDGYIRADGIKQKRAIAFIGRVRSNDGRDVDEVFVADLPEKFSLDEFGAETKGSATRLPKPPQSVQVRRLTHTLERRFPGVQGPRHWMHSSPDGTQIGFYMRDDTGAIQFHTVSPNGGPPRQVTHHAGAPTSGFNFSPDGKCIVYAFDGSIVVVRLRDGVAFRLTPKDRFKILPWAVVWSPDGQKIAFQISESADNGPTNRIAVIKIDPQAFE